MEGSVTWLLDVFSAVMRKQPVGYVMLWFSMLFLALWAVVLQQMVLVQLGGFERSEQGKHRKGTRLRGRGERMKSGKQAMFYFLLFL